MKAGRRPIGTFALRSAPLAFAALVLLAGCASPAIDANFETARQLGSGSFGADLKWLRSDKARDDAKSAVDRLLAEPLAADDATRIALAYSPSLQAMLFERAAGSAAATQTARLPNPIFSFERLARNEGGGTELEINRMLAFSLGNLLLLPARRRLADFRQQQAQFQLAGDAVQAAADARQAWVRAVAAQQSVRYVLQVKASADASAELARRMQAVGNFSKLQRAREQAFSADAVVQLARARQVALGAREALVRSLGLNAAQAAALKLPERLPDLPKTAKDDNSVAQAALDQRLDIRLARANLDFAARSAGLARAAGFANGVRIAGVRHSETGRSSQRGFELDLPLPIFDAGDAARAEGDARYMAALHRTAQLAVDAGSQVRESYAAYRTAYDIATHYRDEIVPLRKTIAEENVLRYNGMLIGVFELLADAREQIASVLQAIDAERDFWLADAALQAALIGKPMAASLAMESRPPTASAAAGGH